jgi:hypothetical protein
LWCEEKAEFIGDKMFKNAAYLFFILDDKKFISLPKKNKYPIISENFDFDTDIINVNERLKNETEKVIHPDDKTLIKYLANLQTKIFNGII